MPEKPSQFEHLSEKEIEELRKKLVEVVRAAIGDAVAAKLKDFFFTKSKGDVDIDHYIEDMHALEQIIGIASQRDDFRHPAIGVPIHSVDGEKPRDSRFSLN